MRRVGETVRCEGAPLGVGGRDRRWGRAAARQPVPRGPRPEGSESEEGTPEDAAREERRRGAELEDPIDRMCEQFPDDVAQAQRLQKKLAEHVRHLLRPQQDGPAQVAHAAEADE